MVDSVLLQSMSYVPRQAVNNEAQLEQSEEIIEEIIPSDVE